MDIFFVLFLSSFYAWSTHLDVQRYSHEKQKQKHENEMIDVIKKQKTKTVMERVTHRAASCNLD